MVIKGLRNFQKTSFKQEHKKSATKSSEHVWKLKKKELYRPQNRMENHKKVRPIRPDKTKIAHFV